MAAAHREHGSIDLGTVVTVAAQWIDNLGGLPYVTELSDHVTAIGPTYYAGLVEDAFRRRSVWLATARVHHDVTSALTASHALDLLTQAAEEEANRAPAEPQTMHTILGATWDAIREYQYGAAGLVKSGLSPTRRDPRGATSRSCGARSTARPGKNRVRASVGTPPPQ